MSSDHHLCAGDQRTTDSSPVTVEGDRVHARDMEMEPGRYYMVVYKNRTLAVRKTEKGRIEVYRLPR